MKTVIMAGGRGARIAELFPDIPKPLIPIRDSNGIEKPVLEWKLMSLRDQGYQDIILTVSYMAERIQSYFGDGSGFGVNIRYFVEDTPIGNAGALFKIRNQLKDDFLLLNADTVFEVDLNRFAAFHRAKGGLVSLFTHPNSHPYDSGLIIADDDGVVEQWLTKEDRRPEYYKNRVNAGLHIMNPIALDMALDAVDVERLGMETDGKVVRADLDRQILKPLCGKRQMFAYDSPEYVKDMGTPERYEQVSRDFANRVVEAKSFRNKQRAIFIDRDGTINKYVGFLRNIDEFELMDGVTEAIRIINASGYLAIVITNQPVVARSEVTVPELRLIHNKLETLLGAEGAYIDGLYYCPHHPHKGYPGEVPELKIDCECRKPKPGMLIKASGDFNIDLASSWMIGDGESDAQAGRAAGCHTALIDKTGKNQANAEIVVKNLREGVERILGLASQ